MTNRLETRIEKLEAALGGNSDAPSLDLSQAPEEWLEYIARAQQASDWSSVPTHILQGILNFAEEAADG